MEILDRIKALIGIKDKKLLEAPISALTREQKNLLCIHILREAKKSGNIPQKLFQLVDSLSEMEKQNEVYRIVDIGKALKCDEQLVNKLEQELHLRYDTKDELKRKTFSFAINYRNYQEKLLEKVLPYLNRVEIQAFLASEGFYSFALTNEDKKRIYKVLLENGIDIGQEKIEEYCDNDPKQVSKVIQSYPINKQIEMWKRKFENTFNLEEYENLFREYIITLPLIERFVFKLNSYEIGFYKDGEDIEILSIEQLNELIEKYNDIIPQEEFKRYLTQKYSLEELNELIAGDSNLVKDNKQIHEAIIKKQADEDVEKYKELQSEEEKDEFFLNLSINTLKENSSAFYESLERMDKDKLKQKLSQIQNIPVPIFYIIKQRFSTEEIYNLLKQEEIQYTEYEINQLINKLGPEQIKELIFNDRFKSNFIDSLCLGIIKQIKDIEEETTNQQLKVLLYEILEKYGNKIRYTNLKGILKTEDVQKIIHNYPQAARFINYSDFSLKEMESLSQTCKDEEYYNLNVISRSTNRGKIKPEEQQLLRNLKINSYCNLINSGKTQFDNDYDQFLSDINNIKEIFDNLKDDGARINFIDNDHINMVIFDMQQEEYFLSQVDKTGQLLKLYKTINSQNISKLENARDDEKDGRYARIRFKWNLKTIYENREKLIVLTEKNPTTLLTINYSILKIFEDTDLEFFSKYHSLNMINFNESEISIEFQKKIVGEISTKMQYPEELITNCLRCCCELQDETIKQLLETEPIDKIIYLMNSHPELFQKSNQTYEIIRDFEKAEQEYCDNKVRNSQSNIQDVLDAYMRRFFNLTYDEANKKVREYQAGLEELIKRYETKEKLSIQEQQELSSLRQLLYIKEILNIKDIDILRQCYEEFIKEPNISMPNYMETLMMSEMVKSAYSKEKIENLFVPELGKQNDKIIFNGSEIDIYHLKDNWNMLITVVGAYNKNKKAVQNPKDEWNAPDKNVNHGICTSLIGNNNLSMAYRKDNLIYGFYKLSSTSIKSEASYDLSTDSSDIQIRQAYENQFRTTENLKSNVRKGHSEVLIERRAENGETEKRQPDYIIAINKIRECDKKAASEFGIPIVFINTKEIAELESQKLRDLELALDEELSVENLSQLVDRYHSNYAGLTTVDPKSCRKYFNPQKTSKYFKKIADDICMIQETQQKLQLAKEYRRLLLEEENKRRGVQKQYIPFKFDEIIKKLDNLIFEESRKQVSNSDKPKTGLDYIKVNGERTGEIEQSDEKRNVVESINRGGRDE